jgi:exopolyphosphatase / guanosine-5'-triphosphate,3'-diphosphate pyrophosphatase
MTNLSISGVPPRSRRNRAPRGPVYAALDLGTNNCRLLIARPAPEGFTVIDSFSRIVRLGEGVGATGQLSDAAMERTVDALAVCARKMRRRGVTHSRLVATEACRRASNGDAFIRRVEDRTGLALEVISHDEEAALAVRGCATLLDPSARRALVFDIGGGSTELTWLDLTGADGPQVLGWTSLPHGVVTLAERVGGGRIAPDEFDAMVAEIAAELAPFEAAHDIARDVARGAVQMLGSSGTVTTLAGVHLGLKRYDRSRVDGIYLDFADIERSSRALSSMNCAERAAQPTIGPGRADLVVAGCAILTAVMLVWPVGRLRVADRGLREGILRILIEAERPPLRAGAA